MLTAALELFAVQSAGSVTVGDIAERAGVTPAAIYYHFPSKDHIVRSCVQLVGEQCVDVLATAIDELPSPGGMDHVTAVLLDWLTEHEESALLLFVTSVGLSIEVEALRLEARLALLRELVRLVRRLRPEATAVVAAVRAAGLVSWVETSARSWIERDDIYRGLGRRDFGREMADLGERMLGALVTGTDHI